MSLASDYFHYDPVKHESRDEGCGLAFFKLFIVTFRSGSL